MDTISLELLRLCDEVLGFAKGYRERLESAKGDKEKTTDVQRERAMQKLSRASTWGKGNKEGKAQAHALLGKLKEQVYQKAGGEGGKRCGVMTSSGHRCMRKTKGGPCFQHVNGAKAGEESEYESEVKKYRTEREKKENYEKSLGGDIDKKRQEWKDWVLESELKRDVVEYSASGKKETMVAQSMRKDRLERDHRMNTGEFSDEAYDKYLDEVKAAAPKAADESFPGYHKLMEDHFERESAKREERLVLAKKQLEKWDKEDGFHFISLSAFNGFARKYKDSFFSFVVNFLSKKFEEKGKDNASFSSEEIRNFKGMLRDDEYKKFRDKKIEGFYHRLLTGIGPSIAADIAAVEKSAKSTESAPKAAAPKAEDSLKERVSRAAWEDVFGEDAPKKRASRLDIKYAAWKDTLLKQKLDAGEDEEVARLQHEREAGPFSRDNFSENMREEAHNRAIEKKEKAKQEISDKWAGKTPWTSEDLKKMKEKREKRKEKERQKKRKVWEEEKKQREKEEDEKLEQRVKEEGFEVFNEVLFYREQRGENVPKHWYSEDFRRKLKEIAQNTPSATIEEKWSKPWRIGKLD